MMRLLFSSAVTALSLILLHDSASTCTAFSTPSFTTHNSPCTRLQMSSKWTDTSSGETTNNNNRRSFLSKILQSTTAFTTTSSFFLLTNSPLPSNAFGGGGLSKVNAKLSAYGLPQLKELPGGFSPLLELYGKAKNRKPLLVEFLFPSDWVVVLPNIDVNGEEGTIQAGQYSAGDTATFFVMKDAEMVEDITTQPKEFFQNAIIKAISQKGDNIYQNFKILKTEASSGEYKNQKYMLVDFKYELLTGAGFEVERRGVASVTNQGSGGDIQLLWAASTRQRFKKTEPSLRTIASSFRCYAEGVGLQLAQAEDEF